MVKMNFLFAALIFAALVTTQFAAAQSSTTPNPCDPAQQEIILQYVSDQVAILQNSGVTPIRGLSNDDNKTFLKLWARSYLNGLCQGSATTPSNDANITNILSRLTVVENALKAGAGGVVDLTPVNIRLSGLESSMNQLIPLKASVTAINNQIAFLSTAVSGDQASLTSLQSSLDSLNSRVSRLTTGPAAISNVTIAKDAVASNAYKISWRSDVPSSANIEWGYSHGYYPYLTGMVPSGQNCLILYANRGATLYLKVLSIQSLSGVKSESEEFVLVAP